MNTLCCRGVRQGQAKLISNIAYSYIPKWKLRLARRARWQIQKITCIQYLRTTHSVANHVFKLLPLEIPTHDTIQFYAKSANFLPIRMLLMDFEHKKHFTGMTTRWSIWISLGKGLSCRREPCKVRTTKTFYCGLKRKQWSWSFLQN